MTTNETAPRTPTAIDALADGFVTKSCELYPTLATSLGIEGYDALLPDRSPSALDKTAQLARETLAELDRLEAVDSVDAVTRAAMHERLGLEVELYEAGEFHRDLNVIASPLQERDTFDMMPDTTEENWANIASRLRALNEAFSGYQSSLLLAKSRGHLPAIRQVEKGAKYARELGEAGGFFDDFAARGAATAPALASKLERAATSARRAHTEMAQFLEQELAPHAPARDGVGEERYSLWSRYFLGAKLDLRETYEWGLEELQRVISAQESTVEQLYGPGVSIEEAMERLDKDETRKLRGTEQLRQWMQKTSDEAVTALAGTHFDIPGPARELECCIAPSASGGIYYTGPSDDFSRPGRMWWSVPQGVEEFGTWREKTTVYHEGVPGHHLQIAQTVYRRQLLNNWRRHMCWVSGHGEGWALYAEELMAELGFLDDPGDRLGMLDGQRMRAARVVLDIGVHLGLPAPEHLGAGTWDSTRAWEFLRANANMDEAFLAFELDRYLGWPGQAPSYKVGQRIWDQLRQETQAAQGASFSLPEFHRRALDLGSLGLDTLADALRGKYDTP